ncbi:MAG: hypothetical protein Q7S28_04035 [bacterium]|nr:hypothetical protein [bacterium]
MALFFLTDASIVKTSAVRKTAEHERVMHIDLPPCKKLDGIEQSDESINIRLRSPREGEVFEDHEFPQDDKGISMIIHEHAGLGPCWYQVKVRP